MKKVKAVIVKPMEKPYVELIDTDLRSLQKIVGGYIEFMAISSNSAIICNEEGKLNGLPGNRKICNDIIAGTFIVVAINENGEIVSLDDNEANYYLNMFENIEKYTQQDVENCIYINLL